MVHSPVTIISSAPLQRQLFECASGWLYVNKYLRLFRFGNGLMGVIGVVIATFIAAGYGLIDQWLNLVIAALIVITFVAGGNSLNDYIDRDIDKTAHPDRPLPTGELQPKMALYCGIGGLIIAAALSLLISIWTALVVVIAALLMIGYETLLKQRGFIGNLCIAVLTGAVFIFGGAIVNDFSRVWVLALLAALVSVGREIAKDIEDMKGDAGSRITLPMSIGVQRAAAVAAAFFIAGPALSFLPLINGTFGLLYCTVIVADAIFIYCAVMVFKDAHRTEKTAKVAMLAALISFVLGVI